MLGKIGKTYRYKRKLPLLLRFLLTCRFLTDEAIGGGRARVGFEPGHLRPL